MSDFMQKACEEARKGVLKRAGGPFGAVVIVGDKIISKAHNSVVGSNDPTAHAEINAIRKACKKLGRFDLSDCKMYTVCEPCPMCYSAICWSRIKQVYYVLSRRDAARMGFDDAKIYASIQKGKPMFKVLKIRGVAFDDAKRVFSEYYGMKNKVKY